MRIFATGRRCVLSARRRYQRSARCKRPDSGRDGCRFAATNDSVMTSDASDSRVIASLCSAAYCFPTVLPRRGAHLHFRTFLFLL